jgi:hypothetical protein
MVLSIRFQVINPSVKHLTEAPAPQSFAPFHRAKGGKALLTQPKSCDRERPSRLLAHREVANKDGRSSLHTILD